MNDELARLEWWNWWVGFAAILVGALALGLVIATFILSNKINRLKDARQQPAIELAARSTPRRIDPEQLMTLARSLAGQPPARIVVYYIGDPEAMQFARILAGALNTLGWTVLGVDVFQRIGGSLPTGIEIHARQRDGAARRLHSGLAQIGFSAIFRDTDRPAIHVLVGYKPQ